MRAIGWCLACPLTLAPMAGTLAAGFAIKEQSVAGQGTAYAGVTASAEDPSSMFFNPAAIAFQEGSQTMLIFNYIQPRSRVKNGQAVTAAGTPVTGDSSQGDIADGSAIPAFYASAELGQGWSAGLAVTVPFGLATNYSDGWVGRYHGLHSELKTININPVLAWRPRPWLGLGLGFQAQWSEADLSNAVDFGSLGVAFGVPGAVPGGNDGRVKIKGDDWGYGLTAGALVEPGIPGLRVGVAFRSEVDHTLRGKADFELDNTGVGGAISGATGLFTDTDASADFKTPASLSLGFRQELGKRWAVLGETSWTDWSTFKELRVDFDNPDQPANVTEERWNDTWFAALGLEYLASDRWTLRGGVAYDQSPVTDKHRTPRIPDSDRYWLSIGAGYKVAGWLSLDVAYSHLFLEDVSVDLTTSSEGNDTRGTVEADYETQIDLFAISATIRF